MSSSQPSVDPRAKEISFSDDELVVLLADGRRIATPLSWFPRLLRSTREQRESYELIGGGAGIHWPVLDEGLSVAGPLRGHPSAAR